MCIIKGAGENNYMWVIFAILNPISESVRSLFIKKASQQTEPIILTWANNLIPVLLFPVVMWLTGTEIKSNIHFWYGFLCAGVIQITASVLYMQAIANGDISTVVPMLSFSPLFLLIFGPIIIGEFPNGMGLAGIVLIVAGSYLLNLDLKRMNLLEPFKSMIKNKGTRLMFIVSILWALSGTFDKISITNSSVIQHITFTNLLIFIVITTYLLYKKKLKWEIIKGAKGNLALISGFTTASYFFHYSALALTLVAYVVALKRMSGMFAVILGAVFLKEANIKQRILGSFIMFIGVLLIVFS